LFIKIFKAMLKTFIKSITITGISLFLFLCFIVITFIIYSFVPTRENSSKQLIFIKGGLIYNRNEDQPMSGKVKDTINSKILEYDVTNGKKNGEFVVKSMAGRIEISGQVKNNKNYGLWKYYYGNGQIESQGYFTNDKPVNKWMWYYKNGKIKQVGFYRLGLKEGEWINYDESGNTLVKYFFQNDNLMSKILYNEITSI
jgi:antitoxin component YwqK of YwqJK toxin-antitoxin module